jgi:flagellar biosynthesis anti-sigma factor FlgM
MIKIIKRRYRTVVMRVLCGIDFNLDRFFGGRRMPRYLKERRCFMKISDYVYTGAVKSYNKNSLRKNAKSSDFSSEFSQALDTVEISSDGMNRLEDKDVRMDKVTYFKQQISAGTYKLDSAAVARNILCNASLG